MAFSPYTFWVDIDGNRLVTGAGTDSTVKAPQFIQGDTAKVEIHALKRIDGVLKETDFPSGGSIRVAVGQRESNPTAGTFQLAYLSELTAVLPYNVTPSAMQTALNALSTITSDGGVVVSKVGDGYLIVWNTGLSHSPITSIADGLFPRSVIKITELDSSTQQTVFLHLAQSVIAYSDTWTILPNPVASSTVLSPYDGATSKTMRLSITNRPSGGYVNLAYIL